MSSFDEIVQNTSLVEGRDIPLLSAYHPIGEEGESENEVVESDSEAEEFSNAWIWNGGQSSGIVDKKQLHEIQEQIDAAAAGGGIGEGLHISLSDCLKNLHSGAAYFANKYKGAMDSCVEAYDAKLTYEMDRSRQKMNTTRRLHREHIERIMDDNKNRAKIERTRHKEILEMKERQIKNARKASEYWQDMRLEYVERIGNLEGFIAAQERTIARMEGRPPAPPYQWRKIIKREREEDSEKDRASAVVHRSVSRD